jgi:hypothetical protein
MSQPTTFSGRRAVARASFRKTRRDLGAARAERTTRDEPLPSQGKRLIGDPVGQFGEIWMIPLYFAIGLPPVARLRTCTSARISSPSKLDVEGIAADLDVLVTSTKVADRLTSNSSSQ